ncbi:MAG: TIGR01212 family radical SAM protein, partial [Planctomycetes bacterium]|nr:TIGR01212 family radical SAM protein [Planctomycetota bacterium]
ISLDAGMTCPTRDVAVARCGCTYCNNESFHQGDVGSGLSITEQMSAGIAKARRRGVTRVLPYFQTFSNTYAPLDRLRALWDEALGFPEVVGLAIGTRPDCIEDEKLNAIGDLTHRVPVFMEYGLESMRDRTLAMINRGHDVARFVDAVSRTHARRLPVCAHVILGFPGETRDELLEVPAFLGRIGVDGVKIHQLHVVRKTAMEAAYHRGEVPVFTLEEYRDLVCDFLEVLSPEIVVERLFGTAPAEILVAPLWSLDRARVQREIEDELLRRSSFQGCRC